MTAEQWYARSIRSGSCARDCRGEVEAVDRIAPVGGQFDAVTHLGRPGPRLRELAGQPADLDDGNAGAVGEHHCHLQNGLQLGPDRVGSGARERLGAVTALQHEGLAASDRSQPLPQQVALAGEHQRRQPG